MKKPAFILFLGIVACAAAFLCFYLVGTASTRDLMNERQPELAWLKKEFNLGDAEFARIVALHQAYLPQCEARCKVIEQQNARLQILIDEAGSVTPEIQALLDERARMRKTCEAEMLEHFLAVSRTMPEAQGKRYLAWVEQQTFMRGDPMVQQHHTSGSSHQH